VSTAARAGYVRFTGYGVGVFYMAICETCDVSIPFVSSNEREEWVREHRTTGHRVDYAVDIRPVPGSILSLAMPS
jgi:hypothetical protein